MKFNEIKEGMIVEDRWFPHWGIGKVADVLKTRVIVLYPDGLTTYDKAHVQFLIRGGR